jgi:hypothetical protein
MSAPQLLILSEALCLSPRPVEIYSILLCAVNYVFGWLGSQLNLEAGGVIYMVYLGELVPVWDSG